MRQQIWFCLLQSRACYLQDSVSHKTTTTKTKTITTTRELMERKEIRFPLLRLVIILCLIISDIMGIKHSKHILKLVLYTLILPEMSRQKDANIHNVIFQLPASQIRCIKCHVTVENGLYPYHFILAKPLQFFTLYGFTSSKNFKLRIFWKLSDAFT